MDKDWIFTGDDYTCDLRTVGVLIKNNMILVQREKDRTGYALPGGHIKIGETLEDGLIREMKEEIGVGVRCVRLLWSEECFWEWDGKQAHTIAFYYQIDSCDELDIPKSSEFVSQKDNCNVVLGWMPIEELQKVTIYPEFLKEEIYHLNGPMKHFVSKEESNPRFMGRDKSENWDLQRNKHGNRKVTRKGRRGSFCIDCDNTSHYEY